MRKVWKKVRILNATICAFIWTSSPGSKASLQSLSRPFYSCPRQSESLASFQVTKSTEQNLCDADMNHNIPIVSHFGYIGKYIYSSLEKKNMRKNSTQIMKSMDMLCRLPNSPSARIAIIKMNVLPKIDFYSFISCVSSTQVLGTFTSNNLSAHMKMQTSQNENENFTAREREICRFLIWVYTMLYICVLY